MEELIGLLSAGARWFAPFRTAAISGPQTGRQTGGVGTAPTTRDHLHLVDGLGQLSIRATCWSLTMTALPDASSRAVPAPPKHGCPRTRYPLHPLSALRRWRCRRRRPHSQPACALMLPTLMRRWRSDTSSSFAQVASLVGGARCDPGRGADGLDVAHGWSATRRAEMRRSDRPRCGRHRPAVRPARP